jgi:dienelactone hydrolase
MSAIEPFTLDRPGGGALHGLVDLPDGTGPRPAVVICHGFKGFMEWGFFPALAALLAERGFVAVRFNLSGTGMLPGDELVTDPAAFRDNTHSAELADLLQVLEATVAAGTAGTAGTASSPGSGGSPASSLARVADGRIDPARIGLLGHSRGGGAAVLAAARDQPGVPRQATGGAAAEPWRERVRALVTWAAIARVDRYSTREKQAWRAAGELPVANARTGQQLALGRGLLEDVERHAAGDLDILAAAGRRSAPWLIVHGDEDESVPASEAIELDAHAAGPHELLLIPGASHTFGARHPFAGPTPFLIQALNATQAWFRRYL